ncbi:MAG: putative enzyme related to lactoylglutathione lyase [Gammaproteobacteria bacterium]
MSWFEILVIDFVRAKVFYESMLGMSIETMAMGLFTMGILSLEPSVVGGAIVQGGDGTPSKSGSIVFLNGGDDLVLMLARVEEAGGSIAVPKTEIGNDFGFFAHFICSEGNKVGLHSMQ